MPGGSSQPHHKKDTVQRSGLVWGVDRGHKTERRVPRAKPSNRKGRSSQSKAVVKSVVREVAGFAPYERRAMELIRNSKVSLRPRGIVEAGSGMERSLWTGKQEGLDMGQEVKKDQS